MEQAGIQLGGFHSRLLWVISPTSTSLSLLFPAWPKPRCSASTPLRCDHPGALSWFYPSAVALKFWGRERGREEERNFCKASRSLPGHQNSLDTSQNKTRFL